MGAYDNRLVPTALRGAPMNLPRVREIRSQSAPAGHACPYPYLVSPAGAIFPACGYPYGGACGTRKAPPLPAPVRCPLLVPLPQRRPSRNPGSQDAVPDRLRACSASAPWSACRSAPAPPQVRAANPADAAPAAILHRTGDGFGPKQKLIIRLSAFEAGLVGVQRGFDI